MASDTTAAEKVDRLGVMVMKDTSSVPEVEQAAAEALEAIESDQKGGPHEPDLHGVLLAQRSFFLGFFFRRAGREREAERAFAEAADTARTALTDRPSSEGERVLSDALQQLLELRGTLYQLLNWRAARDAAIEAIALDQRNPAAYLSAVSYLATAPQSGGGDKEQARRYLDRANGLLDGKDDTPKTMNLRFLAAVWEGHLEASRGRAAEATRAFDRAAEVYPENRWLAEMRSGATADLRNQ